MAAACRAGGYVPKAVAAEWFAGPRAFVAAVTGGVGTAKPVPGGYRVTGRWPFGSGAHHASLFMVLAAEEPNGPQLCCYVGRNDVTILDNWHVSGLRGTGSCDFELRDMFLPAAHVHPFLDVKPSDPGLVYRMPPISVFAWTISAVPLGIARGAIDAFVELAKRARTALRMAATHTAETSVNIVDMLANSAGSASIFETCRLERAMRDARAAARHVAMGTNNYVVGGRVALGLDPGTARY